MFSKNGTGARRLWIEWGAQRRNLALSKILGARLFRFDLRHRPYLRYPVSLFMTLFMLIKERPRVIFVQNPSSVLTLFAILYRKLLGLILVVDAHNEALHPFNGRKRWANKLALYILRNADLTIVTNEKLKEYVDSCGGKSFVLPDPVYDPGPPNRGTKLGGSFNVLFICTYAPDEPYMEVIKAAGELNNGICIYITGTPGGKEREFAGMLPRNVVITGYLADKDYFDLLHACDVVMDLTTREDCLVCGAYEALGAEKPMILSNTKALREYFYKGALYTDNTAGDLAKTIEAAIADLDRLKREIAELKRERTETWSGRIARFDELLHQIEKPGRAASQAPQKAPEPANTGARSRRSTRDA